MTDDCSPVGPGLGAEWRLLDRSHRTAQDGVGPARDWRCPLPSFPLTVVALSGAGRGSPVGPLIPATRVARRGPALD
jgi:hypothetical protein